jgi:hypothetical protein
LTQFGRLGATPDDVGRRDEIETGAVSGPLDEIVKWPPVVRDRAAGKAVHAIHRTTQCVNDTLRPSNSPIFSRTRPQHFCAFQHFSSNFKSNERRDFPPEGRGLKLNDRQTGGPWNPSLTRVPHDPTGLECCVMWCHLVTFFSTEKNNKSRR